MRVDRVQVRAAQDLAALATQDIIVNCAGAEKVVLQFRAASSDAPSALSASEYSMDGLAFLAAGAPNVTESGDAIAGSNLFVKTSGTGVHGRTRIYAAPSGIRTLPGNFIKCTVTGHATNTITGLEIIAWIHRPDADGFFSAIN